MAYKELSCEADGYKLKVTPEEKLSMSSPEGEVRENFTNDMTSKQRLKAIGICQLDKVRKYSSGGHAICKVTDG